MSDRMKSAPGFANIRCYARALKGCCRQMSGEHPLSRAILKRIPQEFTESRAIAVRNMAFQPKDTAQFFGVGSLESKVLCSHHNGLLSPLDAVALAIFDAFEAMHYAAAGIKAAAASVYSIDGNLLERWMLKVVCGGLYSGMMRADGGTELKGIEPALDWLELITMASRSRKVSASTPSRHRAMNYSGSMTRYADTDRWYCTTNLELLCTV
jgi:hypothetical protein